MWTSLLLGVHALDQVAMGAPRGRQRFGRRSMSLDSSFGGECNMNDAAIARVLAEVDALGLTHANLGLFETNGTYRSKRYNVAHLKKAMTEGIAFLGVPSGLHPGDDIIPTNRFVDPERGYQDGTVIMDPESCRSTPFDSNGNGIVLIGEFTGELSDYCVRSLLRRELDRLAGLGLAAYGAFELEGAVLAESSESLRTKRAADVALMPGFGSVYSFVEQSGNSALFDELIEACEQMGLPLDTAHAEYKHLLEVALAPAMGLRIADNAALYKAVAKLVARRHDAYVSFMARRNETDQGCGAHVNVSLKSLETGEGLFFDAKGEHRLSDTARQFLGGLVRYLPELFLLLAPHLNSYKRFVPGLFTPLNNSWGVNNKTVALRVVNATPASARVEVRPAGADVCPHLALLAVCLAGRLGIEQRLDPPPPVTGSGWHLEETGNPELPLSFTAAIDAFAGSDVAREALGDGFVDTFVGDRHWQLEAFAGAVTDWELAMFSNL
jgi:glutamine synthetase